jgi:ABC-2 type transport system ATP-binding protein
VAAGKRPDRLILDEPAAALDPLARDGFLADLLSSVAELGATAILSSHLLSDLARACDYLIVLSGARVVLAGDVRDLLDAHRWVTGPRGRSVVRDADGDPVSLEDLARALPRAGRAVRAARRLPGHPGGDRLSVGSRTRAARNGPPGRILHTGAVSRSSRSS